LRNRWFWRLVLFLIFAGEIFYIVYFFSYFQIKEISVSGNAKVKTETIESFIEKGSIFLVDSKKITGNILSSFPQIAEAKIDRKFPDKLNLTITEREAVANFCLEECFLIDKTGVIFAPVRNDISNGVRESDLLKIQKIDDEQLELGSKVLEEEMVNLILDIESRMKNDLKIAINEVLVVSEDRLDIKTAEGWVFYFNTKNDLAWQMTKLKAVLDEEIPPDRRKNLEYIDLRFGNLAPYKYK